MFNIFASRTRHPRGLAGLAGLIFAVVTRAGFCQTPASAPTPAQTAPAPVPAAQAPAADPDANLTQGTIKPKSKQELIGAAWDLLTNAQNPDKHPEIKIQGLAALGTMGTNPRSVKMILKAFEDKDVDVRTAAVLAAGQARDRNSTTDIRRMLDDKEPEVVFTAASVLWKMGDRSGEDILMAVVDGERKAGAGLVNGTMHNVNKDLHSPGTLARLGAMQGASMLLGPFGYGITAYEYIKKNGGDTARVSAIEEIAQNHTPPIRKVLIGATTDKDPTVRAAAAKALRVYHEPEVAKAIAAQFEDSKQPVRLNAAAAYLICAGAVALPRPVLTPKP